MYDNENPEFDQIKGIFHRHSLLPVRQQYLRRLNLSQWRPHHVYDFVGTLDVPITRILDFRVVFSKHRHQIDDGHLPFENTHRNTVPAYAYLVATTFVFVEVLFNWFKFFWNAVRCLYPLGYCLRGEERREFSNIFSTKDHEIQFFFWKNPHTIWPYLN